MPAHYWIETGAYAKALASSERAYALMTQLTALEPDSPHVERYTKHVVAVGYSAAMMLGNYASAQRWGARMSAAFGIGFDGMTDLRFGRYDAAATATGDQFAGAAVRDSRRCISVGSRRRARLQAACPRPHRCRGIFRKSSSPSLRRRRAPSFKPTAGSSAPAPISRRTSRAS